jgi:hypothetical protein
VIERDLIKAAYNPVKTEERVWFLTRTAHVSDSCKKYMVQTLLCKMEADIVHVPYRKHKTDFHGICIHKLLINQNGKLSCKKDTW